MLKIIGVKVKENYYISFERKGYWSNGFSFEYLMNGLTPEKTFNSDWAMVKSEPTIIQKYKSQPDINHRYELIDPELESDKIPKMLKMEDVALRDSEEYYWYWIEGPFKIYQSMYEEKCDKQEDILEDIEFTYNTIMEVDSLVATNGFSYDVQKTQWSHEGTRFLTEKEVKYQLLDEIIFPAIVLPSRPCELTPKQTYKIVRQYIKQNINYDFASITSDYDFCFTVKKKIGLSQAEKFSVDVNAYKKTKRKKLETRYRKFREIECFEMTSDSYSNYTPIKGFRGENQEDLKEKIDNYCKELISHINEPVVDCPHCKGLGVVEELNRNNPV